MILFEVSSIAKKAALGGLAGGVLGAGAYTLGKAGSLYSKYKQQQELGDEPPVVSFVDAIKFLINNPDYINFALKDIKYTSEDNIESVKKALENAAEKMGEKADEAKQAVDVLIAALGDKVDNAKEKIETILTKLASQPQSVSDTDMVKRILRYITRNNSEDIKAAGIAGAGLGAAAGGIYALAKKAKQRRK